MTWKRVATAAVLIPFVVALVLRGSTTMVSFALALVMLGHPDVRLYDASLSEWVTDPSLPMESS